jgi:hypothetical protein
MKLLSKDNINIITDYIISDLEKRVNSVNEEIKSSEEYTNFVAELPDNLKDLYNYRLTVLKDKEFLENQLEKNLKYIKEVDSDISGYDMYSVNAMENWLKMYRESERFKKFKLAKLNNDVTNRVKMALLELKEPDPEIAKEKVLTKMIFEIFDNE